MPCFYRVHVTSECNGNTGASLRPQTPLTYHSYRPTNSHKECVSRKVHLISIPFHITGITTFGEAVSKRLLQTREELVIVLEALGTLVYLSLYLDSHLSVHLALSQASHLLVHLSQLRQLSLAPMMAIDR
jgi:uncharacterized membrane protein